MDPEVDIEIMKSVEISMALTTSKRHKHIFFHGWRIEMQIKDKARRIQGTLRGHKAAITAIELVYLPTSITFTDQSTNITQDTQFLRPSLLTGDETGLVIWWDLATRRPISKWQAQGHKGSKLPCGVTTLQQLGLTWHNSENGSFEVPEIDLQWYGCVLSHGKDGEVKIWRLFEAVSCGDHGLAFKPMMVAKQKLPTPIFTMPVNMLNFSNVEMHSGGVIATPGTQDTGAFDVYEISAPSAVTDKRTPALSRKLKAVDISKFIEIQHDQTTDTVSGQRAGFGIVMKVRWIGTERLTVGYESGAVVIYRIDRQDEKNWKIQPVVVDYTHKPEPITALLYDNVRDIVLTGSSTDKIAWLCNAKHLNDTNDGIFDSTECTKVYHMEHNGISDISISTSGHVGVVTWDGYSRFYEYTDGEVENSSLKFVFKVKRQMPSIADNRLYATDDIKQQDMLHPQKASVVLYSKRQVEYYALKEKREILYNNGMSKNLVRRRLERDLDSRWMLIGYKDGRVAVYKLESE
ncbi:hypothetical protein HII13_004058 [Brettanomyces bruxellensis]|nr:hypothetical protein HII13_004058 [Brettanomyces bruxellensis]